MRTIFLFIIFLFAGLQNSFAGSPDSLFKNAELEASNAGYRKAAEILESILADHRMASVELYYNLGNSYFRLKDYPNAILNYERALRLKPNDEDINFNLSIANQRITDRIEPIPELFYVRWINFLVALFSFEIWGILAIILFCLAILFFYYFQFGKSRAVRINSFYLAIFLVIVTISCYALAHRGYSETFSKNYGIVFAGSVPVKSSPAENSVSLFVVHAGVKVKLIDFIGDWAKIRLEDGNEGWLLLQDLEII